MKIQGLESSRARQNRRKSSQSPEPPQCAYGGNAGRPVLAWVLTALLVASGTGAGAQTRTVVLDEQTPGIVRDAIIDGFPGLAAKDGTPDFGDNTLAVALKSGVTEMRAVVEFPLALLAEVAPDDIVTATLTFNVDDVLSTFGPGTDFDGTGADAILVHTYDGDGSAALSDYRQNDESPVEVSTGPGTITDATLNASGARRFEVDLTARLIDALVRGQAFLGVLWRTTDNQTGTSLDDLGEGSAGPPGARDSRLPFLTIEVKDLPPPPDCGNGTVEGDETCDDGNTVDGDCCSRLCQREPAGAACSDGDTCTNADTCDASGACVSGISLDCDGGSVCSTDTCDPAAGCVHVAVNEGTACDDGNACTTGDVCGGGVCGGFSGCGDGGLDPACEECDDGNVSGADGCSAACRHDAILGGTGRRECLVRFALERPVRDTDGAVAGVQECRDDDPACDADATPGSCRFDVAVCLGVADPRLPECAGEPTPSASVLKPGRTGKAKDTRGALDAGIAAAIVPGCSPAVAVDVPLRGRDAAVRAGKMRLVVRAKAPGAGRDRDTLKLRCVPDS